MQVFRSNGKLLITGEYAVLDGAKSLAVPTTKGQSLEVSENKTGLISWKSLDENDNIWFESDFRIDGGDFQPMLTSDKPEDKETAKRLQQLLRSAFGMNPEAFSVVPLHCCE